MKISIILGLIFIFSCSKKPEDTFDPLCCILPIDVFISVVDETGDDLLDPANPKGIKIDDIKVLAAIDGKEEDLIFYGVYEKEFLSRSNQKYSKYILETTLNCWNNKIKNFPTRENGDTLRLETLTILSWNQKNRDTLRAEIERTYKSVKVKKIWIKGQLIWQQNNGYLGGQPCITMTKKSLQADRTNH